MTTVNGTTIAKPGHVTIGTWIDGVDVDGMTYTPEIEISVAFQPGQEDEAKSLLIDAFLAAMCRIDGGRTP